MTIETLLWIILYIIFCIWCTWEVTGRMEKDAHELFTTKTEIILIRILVFIWAPFIFIRVLWNQIIPIFTKNWEDL